ncbi:MAG TPA: ATP-binding protein [Spirochaetota bacterium]|nr:ATP-binding protein [Spirochaetota bacterium]HNT13097.1 ATP-binding protein [Spirochaetota bacterium]
MVERTVSRKVLDLVSQYPVITITGPRQSGKSTLCRMLFPDREYVSLEDPDERSMAHSDPRQFLKRFPDGAVIDEVQRAPDLLSYIQTIVDTAGRDGMFILTGSQQFELLHHVSQSLAGRTALVRLLPFSLDEAYGAQKIPHVERVIHTGFYPRIFDKKLNPTEAMSFYVSMYIERDLRMLVNVRDLSRFGTFLKLCAGRIGQVLNLSSLGNDCGINHSTARSWISILEASYIITLLHPYYKNFNKRLIKSPKLYFHDTGLACYLLGIHDHRQVASHPLKGMLFESLIIAELMKARSNQVKPDNLYYFRDNTGNEVDVVIDHGTFLDQVEIKSGHTTSDDFFKGIRYFSRISTMVRKSYIIYGGDKRYEHRDAEIVGWKQMGALG